MMTKLTLLITLSCLSTLSFAQKRKEKEIPPPKVEVLEPPVVTEKFSNDAEPVFYAPVVAGSLTQIRGVDASGETVKFDDLAELEQVDFSSLKELHLATQLSDEVLAPELLQKILTEGNQLEVLKVEKFRLTGFPDLNTENRHLKTLVLKSNNLTELPSSLSNLVALESFESSNPFIELPATFSNLEHLKTLSLSDAQFSTFPAGIFDLHQLTFLHVSGSYKNKMSIKELPDSFDLLPDLETISIRSALLTDLPKSFASLKKLKSVDLSNNQFEKLPDALASSTSVEYVPFNDNPLKWDSFLTSVKKTKWSALFFLSGTGFTKSQYEQVQEIMTRTDVYYDGMND